MNEWMTADGLYLCPFLQSRAIRNAFPLSENCEKTNVSPHCRSFNAFQLDPQTIVDCVLFQPTKQSQKLHARWSQSFAMRRSRFEWKQTSWLDDNAHGMLIIYIRGAVAHEAIMDVCVQVTWGKIWPRAYTPASAHIQTPPNRLLFFSL